MDEKELITALQNYLSTRLSVPVKTYPIDDSRPVPVAIIDDWTIQDMNYHNSAFAGIGTVEQENGESITCKYYNFDYEARIEIEIRHQDQVKASILKANVKQIFRLLGENPRKLDESVKGCEPLSDGNPSAAFTEPKENERMVAVSIRGDHTIVVPESETEESIIESIKPMFTFNPKN